MKIKELTELRSKTEAELLKLAAEKKLEADKKRLEATGGKGKNLKENKNLRQEIAKILTLAKELAIMGKLEANKEVKETK